MTANTLFRRGAGLLSGALALLASSMVYAAPQPESGIGLPRDISVEGHRIDWLIRVTGLFVTILFVIMCVWMLLAIVKHNKNHEAEYDHGNARHQVRFAAGLSAVIFFVVDGNLWVNSTVDVTSTFWNFAKAESTPNAVRIEINAHQWAWDARYAGTDGKFNTADDVVTLNDIRVPVNTPVVFQIASADVIHSFWIPNMRIKQDAMPGMINRMWISAKEVGQVDIACTQHCGTNHYKMKGTLTVLTAEEYAKWLAEASANGARSYNPDDKDSHWGWEWRVN
ncbi:MAG: cytochrome C oxidase subunit II [Polyangiaceae bacterium]|nr:cytochrome C oxidase subunit II [Polyangiaceae bacterium]NUQ77526.1 cytochrome C oxidase subunit II [Polyangiaceae bacterium]